MNFFSGNFRGLTSISLENILEINKYVLSVDDENSGVFRSYFCTNVFVRDAAISFVDHSLVERRMCELIDQVNRIIFSCEWKLAPGFALWRVCSIHPFLDGNGRTGRALAIMLIDGHLPSRDWLDQFDSAVFRNYREYIALLRLTDTAHPSETNSFLWRLTMFLLRLKSLHYSH